MHEAGIADRALDAVEAAIPPDRGPGPPRSLSLLVTDPAHIDVDAVHRRVSALPPVRRGGGGRCRKGQEGQSGCSPPYFRGCAE